MIYLVCDFISQETKVTDFIGKQNAKKARFSAKAEELRKSSNNRIEKSYETINRFEGQPILVGHHSEKTHRSILKRAHRQADLAIEDAKKAEYYERKTESVGKGGISSLDDDAILKLEEKLAKHIQAHEIIKNINKAVRKNDIEKLKVLREEQLQCGIFMDYDIIPADGKAKEFGLYVSVNNNSTIKRIQERIDELKMLQQCDDTEEDHENFTYQIDKAEKRILITFEGKPDENIRTILKSKAFKWSKTRTAWTRILTQNAISAGKQVKDELLKYYESL